MPIVAGTAVSRLRSAPSRRRCRPWNFTGRSQEVGRLAALAESDQEDDGRAPRGGAGWYTDPVRRTVLVLLGLAVLSLVTFANPIEGNVLGFCPPSEGPKAIQIDVVVAIIDLSAGWLVYRGLRA